MIDLRSDTISRPTDVMRRAMAEAPVGDDAYGDDPTVRALEAETATLLGKEAALYVPSGTMANQLALRSHTEPGDVVLMDHNAHVYINEHGAPFAISGLYPRFLAGARGVFTAEDVASAVPEPDPYSPKAFVPPVKLVCVESTHNIGGGRVWSLEAIHDVAVAARDRGLALHLDGARLWNATAATGVHERDYAAPFDSVSVCFSKGLGAPVGSALAGSSKFIERARRFRSQFGGSMRQSGIIAAGALHALRNHRARLVEDHAHARLLAEGIADARGIVLDPKTVETNIVRFGLTSPSSLDFVGRLLAAGLRVLPAGASGIRAVTYLNITKSEVEQAIAIIRKTAEA